MNMNLFLNQIVAGFSSGAIYACMALALVMIYQAINDLNFAQGEMATFSTFLAWQLIAWGMPYWAAFVLSVMLSFVGGVAIERVLFKPLHHAPILASLVGFIALYSILNSGDGYLWNYTIKTFPTPFGTKPLFGSALIDTHEAGMIAVSVLMLVALYLFFRGTRLGLAMRAAAANPDSARLVGVRVGWMTALGWGMAAAIGAVAGMLIAPVVFLEPNMMLGALLYGFAGAVLGGLSSPGGAVLGGFAVGIIENLTATYVPYVGRDLKLTIALLVIVAVLMVRPAGIFGRRAVSRV
jgi:branched-chain amino acid transport system permease protein